MKYLIGIVKYCPDPERFKACIDALPKADIYSVDNTENNIGIAAALRQIMDYAAEHKYDWVLTFDQDSIAMPGLIKEYEKYINDPSIGALTCIVKDRNFEEKQPVGEIKECITSGCFMNVNAYSKTQGYDSSLFIDSVDFDICASLREAGYKIVRIPFEGLLHEVGRGLKTPFGFVYNHPAWRKYYIARNRVIVAKKHGNSILKARLKNARDIFLTAVYEKEKLQKIKAILGIKPKEINK